MKDHAFAGKATRKSTDIRSRHSSAGDKARAIAPPDYGIDFIDRGAFNLTGMPDRLKAGIEALSGMDLSDVRVHANSDKPAQLNAMAYAQGNDIHLAPGQERHLPHEAWHLVQQRQGRVKPTMQAKGVAINDNAGLEHEADVMGQRATALPHGGTRQSPLQLKCSECAEDDKQPYQFLRTGTAGNVVQLANCYFFKHAGCEGSRVRGQSKHNFSDYASYNCSGERGGDDCVENNGKGECFCPNVEEPKGDSGSGSGTGGRMSAYDDPSTSRFSRDLIERGWQTGTYPPRH